MKKLIYITGAALVMLASASCEKKETVKEAQPSVEKTEMVFTATSESGALKTTIVDGTKAVWSATDNLKVFTAEDQTGSVCNYKSGAGTATAEFVGQCAKTGPWTAICPANKATGFNNGTITLTMPEAQTYAANTFAAGAMPCVAYSETNTFNFNHSFGVLKLSLKLKSGTSGSVKSITVTDKGGAKLWGTFTVNPQNSAVAQKNGSDGSKSITLNCTNVELSTSTAKDFWIVIPEGAFANGFDVTVTPTLEGLFPATLSTTKANTIKAGEVNKMPEQTIEFVNPTIGYAAVSKSAGISGNQVKWVQLWEGGPKFAEFNVGAKSETECGGCYTWGGTEKLDYEDSSDDCCNEWIDIQGTGYDTAKNLWGDKWQMPSYNDFLGMVSWYTTTTCNVQKVKNYKNSGLNGILFTGKSGLYANNSVFFPHSDDDTYKTYYNYWTSTPEGMLSSYKTTRELREPRGPLTAPVDYVHAYCFWSNIDTEITETSEAIYAFYVRAILKE